ncbi:hypothetical protein SAMN05216338_101034 [Bradyrhizobium sp. Rc2d]|nr:hypothetical protein SAMN05216338_101034 [Bradyrhizobium sp. Rc2d]
MASHSLSPFFTRRGWGEGLPPRMRHFIEPNPRPTSVIASAATCPPKPLAKAEAIQNVSAEAVWIASSHQRKIALQFCRGLLAMTTEADGQPIQALRPASYDVFYIIVYVPDITYRL